MTLLRIPNRIFSCYCKEGFSRILWRNHSSNMMTRMRCVSWITFFFRRLSGVFYSECEWVVRCAEREREYNDSSHLVQSVCAEVRTSFEWLKMDGLNNLTRPSHFVILPAITDGCRPLDNTVNNILLKHTNTGSFTRLAHDSEWLGVPAHPNRSKRGGSASVWENMLWKESCNISLCYTF